MGSGIGANDGLGLGDGLGVGLVGVGYCSFGGYEIGARGREGNDGYRLEKGYEDSGLLWCLKEMCPWTSEVVPIAGGIVSSAGAVVRGWVPRRFPIGLNGWTAGRDAARTPRCWRGLAAQSSSRDRNRPQTLSIQSISPLTRHARR